MSGECTAWLSLSQADSRVWELLSQTPRDSQLKRGTDEMRKDEPILMEQPLDAHRTSDLQQVI